MNQHTPTELRCAPVQLETSAAQDSSSSKEYPYVRSQSSATSIASCDPERSTVGREVSDASSVPVQICHMNLLLPLLFCWAPRKPRSIRRECYPPCHACATAAHGSLSTQLSTHCLPRAPCLPWGRGAISDAQPSGTPRGSGTGG